MCVAALPCVALFALDPHQPLGQLHHSFWNAKNGLNGSVVSLAQTTDGFLWVGTTDGLFRFDGLYFERYRPEHRSLPASSVSTLMAVPDGGLWIGFDRGGVSFLKNGAVTNYTEREGLPVSGVRSFAQDSDGTIWAAIVGGFTRLDGGRWRKVHLDWNYLAKSAWTLLVDRLGTLWVASGDRILFLPKGAKKFQDVGLQTGRVFAFTQAPDGALLFADDRGVSRSFRSPLDRAMNSLPPITIPSRISLFDRDGAMWIGGKGISRLSFPQRLRGPQVSESSPGVERFTEKEGLTSNDVQTILEDREGNIWVGTDGGLDRFRHRNLEWFPLPSGTSSFSLVAGDHGEVWAGSDGDRRLGMVRVQDGKIAHGGPQNAFMTYRDPSGAIWISAKNALLQWHGGTFSEIALPPQALEMHRSPTKDLIAISSVTKDHAGGLWISIGGLGEFQRKDGVWKFVEVLKDHPDWSAGSAFTDAADRIWLMWGDIVAVIDHGKVQTFSSQQGLDVRPCTMITGRGQQVWVGGEGGLAFLRGERFHALKGSDGNGFGAVTGIVVTANDGLWLSAGSGIVHISQPEILHALQLPEYRVSYDVLDLVSDLPEQLQRQGVYSSGAIQGTDGLLWFATRAGVAKVDPAHIFRNPLPPPIAIRSIIADGRSYSISNATLPALTKTVQIDYTALSLSIPERVRYRYRFDDSDREWQDAGVRRQAFYTNPKPGRYRFHVIACNNDGVWNESGATVDFNVAPAFYQTIWFQLLCWASAAGILWLFYLLRLKQAKAQVQSRLEERLAERERIARELHDTLLQSFHGLLFRFQAARNMLPRRPEEAMQALDGAIERTEEAIAEGRGAIQDLRSEPSARIDLEHLLTPLGPELAASDNPNAEPANFRVMVEGERRSLSPILQDEVYRIAHEVLRNAFQHARARQIEVEIRYDDRLLRVRIRDDGKGIDPRVLQDGRRAGHWGLPGIRERAKQIGGRLDFWSQAGAGTEVQLTVPAAIAYERSNKSSGRSGPGFRLFRKKTGAHERRS